MLWCFVIMKSDSQQEWMVGHYKYSQSCRPSCDDSFLPLLLLNKDSNELTFLLSAPLWREVWIWSQVIWPARNSSFVICEMHVNIAVFPLSDGALYEVREMKVAQTLENLQQVLLHLTSALSDSWVLLIICCWWQHGRRLMRHLLTGNLQEKCFVTLNVVTLARKIQLSNKFWMVITPY